jgi:hypothetical protein
MKCNVCMYACMMINVKRCVVRENFLYFNSGARKMTTGVGVP